MLLESNTKLLFIGDSITDCGRKRPIGEGANSGWGSGYVDIIVSKIGADHPDKNIQIQNMGIGGHTIRNLRDRWQTDVLDLKPDYLSIKVGINDVWRFYDSPERNIHVSIEEFEDIYCELLDKTLPTIKNAILMTPYFLQQSQEDPLRATMDKYGAIVKKIAKKYKTLFVDVQTAYDVVLRNMHPTAIATDYVHPNVIGHTIIANAFIKAIN